jgi:hypothetical protein
MKLLRILLVVPCARRDITSACKSLSEVTQDPATRSLT